MIKLLIIVLLLVASGCTDAQLGKLSNIGNSANIECYSGGKLIYKGTSTGKVSNEENSDGYFFKEEKTGRLLEVSGNCIIEYK